MKSTNPVQLKKTGQERFRIVWDDGHQSDYTFRYLRQHCGCAACINELTGERSLNEQSVPIDLKASRVELVGSYALHFSFSDGHETGIYAFKALREICPCDLCISERIG